MGSGKKRAALASLFGFKNKRQEEEEATAARRQQQRYQHIHRVRPSDDDDYARFYRLLGMYKAGGGRAVVGLGVVRLFSVFLYKFQ